MAGMIKGIDISKYQKGISFADIKNAGVKFVIIRAGLAKQKDKTMDKFVADCIKYGIKYGFYWYSYAKSASAARDEAQVCLKAINGYSPDFPVYFDMEDKSQLMAGMTNQIRTDMVNAFCSEIKKTGYKAGLYINPSWMETYVNKSQILGKWEMWLAHWTNSTSVPSKFNYGQKVWQWGLDKIGRYDVDADVAFFDYSNSINSTETLPKKTISEIAKGVLDGKWGNGDERKKKLAEAGYDYSMVQAEVNRMLKVAKPTAIKVGDKVKVKNGAKTYIDGRLASFVYKNTYTVISVNGDRDVFGVNGVVTAAVKMSDLYLV